MTLLFSFAFSLFYLFFFLAYLTPRRNEETNLAFWFTGFWQRSERFLPAIASSRLDEEFQEQKIGWKQCENRWKARRRHAGFCLRTLEGSRPCRSNKWLRVNTAKFKPFIQSVPEQNCPFSFVTDSVVEQRWFCSFFSKAVYCFSFHSKTLWKVHCDMCGEKKRERNISSFSDVAWTVQSNWFIQPLSLTDLSQKLDPRSQLWNRALPSLRHPKDGIFLLAFRFSWFPSWTSHEEKREKWDENSEY